MEFTTFVRRPFMVEAVEVTEENIAEIAKLIGALKTNPDGSLYINVDRRRFPNLYKVSPGFWMTQMNDNIRCYSKDVFHRQFVPTTSDIDAWFKSLGKYADEEPL